MGGRGSSSGSRKSRNVVSTLIDSKDKDSKLLFTKEGKYTEAREKVHKNIIKNTLKKTEVAREGEKPRAIIVAGGSGTGKSNLRNRQLLNKLEKDGYKRVAVIDNDLVKMQIPEYKKMLDKGYSKASTKVHREAGDIVKSTIIKAVADKRHFVLDTTMSNDKYMQNMIKGLKKRGYDVEVHFTTCDSNTALQRVSRRNHRDRYVPPTVVINSHTASKKTFDSIKKSLDRYTVYDTSGKLPTVTKNVVKNPLAPRPKPVTLPRASNKLPKAVPVKPKKPYTPKKKKVNDSSNTYKNMVKKSKNKSNTSIDMDDFINKLFD